MLWRLVETWKYNVLRPHLIIYQSGDHIARCADKSCTSMFPLFHKQMIKKCKKWSFHFTSPLCTPSGLMAMKVRSSWVRKSRHMVWFARYNRVKEKQHASKEMQQLGKYQAYLSCLHLLILEHVSYETKQIKSN